MRWNLRAPLKQFLIGYLVIAVLVLTAIPADVQAMFLPTSINPTQDDSLLNRQQNLEKLQRLLESKLVSQQLSDLGFSQGEVSSRLDRLSDEQIHYFASHLESLQTGGNPPEWLYTSGRLYLLFLIALLVLVIFFGIMELVTKEGTEQSSTPADNP